MEQRVCGIQGFEPALGHLAGYGKAARGIGVVTAARRGVAAAEHPVSVACAVVGGTVRMHWKAMEGVRR